MRRSFFVLRALAELGLEQESVAVAIGSPGFNPEMIEARPAPRDATAT